MNFMFHTSGIAISFSWKLGLPSGVYVVLGNVELFCRAKDVIGFGGTRVFFLRYSSLNKPSYSKQLHYKYS